MRPASAGHCSLRSCRIARPRLPDWRPSARSLAFGQQRSLADRGARCRWLTGRSVPSSTGFQPPPLLRSRPPLCVWPLLLSGLQSRSPLARRTLGRRHPPPNTCRWSDSCVTHPRTLLNCVIGSRAGPDPLKRNPTPPTAAERVDAPGAERPLRTAPSPPRAGRGSWYSLLLPDEPATGLE